MHAEHVYGHSGGKWAATILPLLQEYNCRSVLDYGAGTGAMSNRLRRQNVQARNFDPAVPGMDQAPAPADLVTCLDVLEHIELEHLDSVLSHLSDLTRHITFVVISTRLAGKILSDGRNAHLIVQPDWWWRNQLQRHFLIAREWNLEATYCAILRPTR